MQQVAYTLKVKFGKPELARRLIPTPKDGEVLIKLRAAAINPVDYAIPDLGFLIEDDQFPTVLGSDGAGDIVALGSGVKGDLKVGDTVFFQGQIGNADASCLQEYAVAPYDILSKVPDNITPEEASTLPVAILAVVVGLYHETGLRLTPPWTVGGKNKYAGESIIVLGGSSSVGQFAIQFAKLSGFAVHTTASSTHAAFLRSLGADNIFPRTATAEDIKAEIKPHTVKYAFAAVPTPETEQLGLGVLEKKEGAALFATRPPYATERYEGPVVLRSSYGSSHLYRDLTREFWANIGGYLKEGVIKPNRVELLTGGLTASDEGVDRVRKGNVSGVKLVLKPDDTPR